MAKEKKGVTCCMPADKFCCQVEALISVDERGQMVLPKEIRDRAKIGAGDKLALVSWEKSGEVCCLFLIKSGDFAEMAKGLLGSIMKEAVGGLK